MTTHKLLGAFSAAALALGAGSAGADVTVEATITKTKDITVTETIDVTKTINVFVNQTITVDAVSEQDVVKNQRNQFNFVEDENGSSTATIGGTGSGASGVLLFNQAPGFANNQGNEVSITFVNSPLLNGQTPTTDGTLALVHAQASVEQVNGWNPLDGEVTPSTPPEEFFTTGVNAYAITGDSTTNSDSITDSFNEDAAGIVGVNQSAGSINNQNNALSIALADRASYALGEADLGQFNTWNVVNVTNVTRTDTISGSFGGFSGVAMVNQSAGAINNQANVLDIAVSTTGLTLP